MTFKKLGILILISLFGSGAMALELKAFQSDGCTMFSNGSPSHPNLWEHCCFEHDLRYWFGGTSKNLDFADLELRACVKSVAGVNWANIIYNGVRAGHSSPLKSKYNWSWGWVIERRGGPLVPDEVAYVKKEINQLPLDQQFRNLFIEKYLPELESLCCVR